MNRDTSLRYFFPLVFVCLLLTVNTPPLAAQQSVAGTAVTDAVGSAFGSAVTPVTAFNPFYLTGDFNGDGAEDVLVVVRVARPRRELPAAVKLLNPFYRRAGSAYPADPAAQPTLGLAIIHGGKTGWQSAAAAARFLLVGESPVLALADSRARSSQPADGKNLLELVKKRPGRRGGNRAPAAARGDAILLGTEAAESLLYWNGATYIWKESEGGD